MIQRILAVILVAIMCMGATCQERRDPVLPAVIPKPMFDYRLLTGCDTVIPDVKPGSDMIAYLENHQLTIRRLDACACKNIALRNQTCKLVANTCEPIAECPGIVYDSPTVKLLPDAPVTKEAKDAE